MDARDRTAPAGGEPTSRRAFLRAAGSACAAVALVPASVLARGLPAPSPDERRLRMFHTHTGETIDIVYFRDGEHLPKSLARLDQFLRDHRTNESREIDPGVLDILWDLAGAVENPGGIYEIISGYRSPKTNGLLRGRSTGVASRSQHVLGKAIDARLRGTDTAALRDAALALRRGGVGYYAESDFVHVDTGRVRRW